MMVSAYAAGLRLTLATVEAKGRNEVDAALEVHEEFVGKPLTPELVAASTEQRRPHRILRRVVADATPPQFRLSWQERDGPAVARPEHQGFGHTVLLRTTEHALGAKCELEFADTGLTWTLSAPLDRVADRPANREFRISA